MNLDPLSFSLIHVENLVANLSKRNYKSSVQEIDHLIELYGAEVQTHLFTCLLSHVDLELSASGVAACRLVSTKDNPHLQYLQQQCSLLITQPNFVYVLSHAVNHSSFKRKHQASQLLSALGRTLRLKRAEEVAYGISLLQATDSDPASTSTRQHAELFVQRKLPDLIRSYIESADSTGVVDEGGLHECSPELLHQLVSWLLYAPPEQLDKAADSQEAFVDAVRHDFPRALVPVVFAPLIYPDAADLPRTKIAVESSTMALNSACTGTSAGVATSTAAGGLTTSTPAINLLDGTLAEYIMEVGYSSCSSVDECRRHLLAHVGGGVSSSSSCSMSAATPTHQLSPACVARVLAAMLRTYSGHSTAATALTVSGGAGTAASVWSSDTTASTSLAACSAGAGVGTEAPHTWNMDVFVRTVHELWPATSWKEVVYNLDHAGFQVADRRSLCVLTQALMLALRLQQHGATTAAPPLATNTATAAAETTVKFPVEMLYRVWKNADSQLSYINQILKNSDVFCLSDHACHMVDVSHLKVAPDKDNKDINTWRCTELVQLLLNLADHGYSFVVQELFKFPVQQCPDVFLLAVLAAGSGTRLAHELVSSLLFVFLAGHHPNSSAVLHQAWHCGGAASGGVTTGGAGVTSAGATHTLIVHAMIEWHRQADTDQTRLSRILDVAQDLKALSLLLNYQSYPFAIDLACLASRREYLKLDKWMSDKVHEHGEPFMAACVKFLQRRVPQMVGSGSGLKELDTPSLAAPLPAPLVATMLSVLHSRVSASGGVNSSVAAAVGGSCAPVSVELSEAVLAMIGSAGQMMVARQRPPPPQQQSQPPPPQPPPGVVRPPRVLDSPFAPAQISSQLYQSHGDSLVGGLNAGISGLSLAASSTAAAAHSSPSPLSALTATNYGFTSGAVSSSNMAAAAVSRPSSVFTQQQLMGTGASLVAPQTTAARDTTSSTTNTPTLQAQSRPTGHDTNMQQQQSGVDAAALSREVEEEANYNFQRIYNHPPHPTLSIEEVLDMLKRYQDSGVSREREVFACMLRSLMDEYKFFPQYPDKELYITAQLFGGIIDHNLVTNYMGLGIALRYVLDAVKKSPGSKMYNFGVVALDRFRHRLREYPQYCQHLAAVEHFAQFPRHLTEYVECGIRSQEPLGRPDGPVLPPHVMAAVGGGGGSSMAAQQSTSTSSSTTAAVPAAGGGASSCSTAAAVAAAVSVSTGRPPAGRPSIANTTNIETLVNALQHVTAPADHVQDKIGFIFNNLSQMNLQQKREDLLDVLEKDYWRWMAQYIVMRRVSIEPNFHTLYANFLDALKLTDLPELVVRELHRNIQVLLRADKGVEKFNDRTILKNLGHWLGLMTIGKNRPILQIDLDPKALIVEAYHLGMHELLYIVPFVAKILESCAKSKIFKPPNPWTLGIMNLFAELHREEDLKLNLKFEIEVLCKTLSLDVKELKPTNWLKDQARLQQLPIQLKRPNVPVQPPPLPPPPALPPQSAFSLCHAGSMMFGEHHLSSGVPASSVALPPPPPPQPPPQQQQSQPPPLSLAAADVVVSRGGAVTGAGSVTPTEPRFSFSDINTASIAGLAPHVVVNAALPLFQSSPQLKQLVRAAVERTVQDWLPRSVERYCKLAVSTAEQMVKKDFALEPDETRLRMAAHQMVVHLTAGLTLINCRDPLLLSISNNVKAALLTTARSLPQQHKEFVEQAAAVAATDNVELACCFIQKTAVERAVGDIDKRLAQEYEARKLARAEGRRYLDPLLASYQEQLVPEQLRLHPLASQQLLSAVYERFVRVLPGFSGPMMMTPATSCSAAAAPGSATDAVSTVAVPSGGAATLFMSGVPVTGALSQMPPLAMRATQPPPLRYPATATSHQLMLQMQQQQQQPSASVAAAAAVTVDDMAVIMDKLAVELQAAVQQLSPPTAASSHGQQLARLADDVAVARGSRDVASHVHLIKMAVDGLLEYMCQPPVDAELALRFRDAHLFVLRALQDPRVHGTQWVQKQVTSFIVEWHDDNRLNADAVEALLRARLISLPQLDAHLAHSMDTANYSVVGLVMQLLQAFLVEERGVLVSETDFANTIEALTKVAQQPGCPENVTHLLELIRVGGGGTAVSTGAAAATSIAGHEMALAAAERVPCGPTSHIHKGISQARDYDDPAGMHEKTEFLMREWVTLYHSPASGRDPTKAFTNIVHQMNVQGILKTDDLITRFFRLSTQLCVDLCYRALNDPAAGSPTMIRDKCFRTLDAFVRLIALLVKHSGESPHAVSKINLLNKVLGIVTGVLLQDHEVRRTDFQQLSYHRIFIMLLLELNAPETVLETINFQVLTAFCNVLHILRPEKAPGFAYAWLDIVSHRVFMGRMLAVIPQHKGWGPYAQLLIDLFNFLLPFLRNAELVKPITVLYKGCLRVLLVLLHDFPEFLCDYHYNFCDTIPANCIQMRNLILSAFPRNMPPPDPFTSKLQVELIPEIREAPVIQTNFALLIQPPAFKNELDTYLTSRTPVTFVTELRSTLQQSPSAGCGYNVSLMNALVLYVGTQAIAAVHAKGQQPNKQTIAHSAHMDIFQSLVVALDTEGRYLFLNAVANQLRYPNSHTNYFLNLLLYLFAEANTAAIQEQITRVLLERLIVNRPHPWGLLVTFIELIKNPTFKFWSHEFVHCAPEIEKLFDSVARSCVAQGQKAAAAAAAVSTAVGPPAASAAGQLTSAAGEL